MLVDDNSNIHTNSKQIKVLYIEDNEVDIIVAKNAIQQYNKNHVSHFRIDFQVIHYPKSTLNDINFGDYDIILCDYNMPGKNGLELWDELQNRYKFESIPIPFFFIVFTTMQDSQLFSFHQNIISKQHNKFYHLQKNFDNFSKLGEILHDTYQLWRKVI